MMMDEGAPRIYHFPAGHNRVTGYNGVFLLTSSLCCLLFPHLGCLQCFCGLPAGVNGTRLGAETLLCPMGWWDAASGLLGTAFLPVYPPDAVPYVALGRDELFSQPWLRLLVLPCSNISSPPSARPKRYFCYNPLQDKQAGAGKGDKPKGYGIRGPGLSGMLQGH